MAAPIGCDICGAELASLLVTNLDTGDTLGVGGACVVGWLRGTADALDPPATPASADAAQADSAAAEGTGGRTSARRPRSKAQRLTVVSDVADDTGAATTPDDATAD